MSDNMKDDIIIKDSNVKVTTLEEEMKKSYLDYAMSVIVSRALPDVRDGLKPVHRRILFAMKEGGYDYNRPFRKSARIVGDVMGKYHPHGDMAIYDAMVRLEQKFSMRLPLVSGQGNFGSMDGDGAAAMRYTEAKMAKSAHELLKDIDKETVNFIPNYDETVYEPVVLPAAYPNILVNGASGIAVGMATNIPPHNLGELIDACCALVDNGDLTIDELMEHYIFGPDFPTGGIILGQQGIYSAFTTGRGSVMMRAKVDIEEIRKDREAIIVTEIPYQVNKSRMVEIIAELARDKKVEGISDIRDESDRQGIRVVIEIKRDFQTNVVLNQLYHHSPLQTSFSVNCLALNNNKPELMNLKDVLVAFLRFREEVITKRTVFELKKSRQRAHVLGGLAVAVENVDEVIELIRSSPNPQQAKERLLGREWKIKSIAAMIKLLDENESSVEKDTYTFSEEQVKGILELRLQRLTGMERDKIIKDLEEISVKIKEYLALLNSRELLLEKLKKELVEVKEEFDTPRRTAILDIEYSKDIEGLIQREDMIVTVSDTGYIKRVPLSTYSSQRRGGKGRRGMTMKDEDIVIDIFMAGTHQMILFFSTKGLVYQLKTYKLPLGTPQSRGKAMVNLLPLSEGEKISTIVALPENLEECKDKYVMFATKLGNVRRNRLSDFMNIRANGKIAMKLANVSDSLIAVRICTEEQDILISSKRGMSIRTAVENVRIFSSRNSTGIRGIRLGVDDEVIGMSVLHRKRLDLETRNAYLKMRRTEELDTELENETNLDSHISLSAEQFNELLEQEEIILTISSQGYGKRSSSYEYRATGRGGKGIAAMKMGDKNKELVASVIVSDDNDVVLVTSSGQIIRCPVSDIRLAGRNTQGVRLFKIDSNDSVVSVSIVPSDKMEDSLEEISDENVNSEEESVSTQGDLEQE